MEKAGPVQLLLFTHRRDGFTKEQFCDYRINDHGKRIVQLPIIQKHLLKYEQYHEDEISRQATEDALGLPQTGFDGVSVLHFATIEAARAVINDPEFAKFAREDRPRFCKMPDVTVSMAIAGAPKIVYERPASG